MESDICNIAENFQSALNFFRSLNGPSSAAYFRSQAHNSGHIRCHITLKQLAQEHAYHNRISKFVIPVVYLICSLSRFTAVDGTPQARPKCFVVGSQQCLFIAQSETKPQNRGNHSAADQASCQYRPLGRFSARVVVHACSQFMEKLEAKMPDFET